MTDETFFEHLRNKGLAPGILAVSKAGHDSGRIYLVLTIEGSFALCVDGRIRLLDRPKRKRVTHLRPIASVSADQPDWQTMIASLNDPGQQNALVRHLIESHSQWQPSGPSTPPMP